MSTFSEPRRPRLLPQNRKLRHLKGLSLRNLSFAPTRLQTADDAGIINTSPSKLGTLRESATGLHASRSSDNLRTSGNESPSRTARPPLRPRKKSLSLAHANPVVRQKKLENLVEGVVGDVFFSLHVPGEDDPVYISEVRERSANFNFQFFELGDQIRAISRSCCLSIRVWARRPKTDSWVYLVDEAVDLRRLNFIGTLDDRKFPNNALIFHLEDGMYSLDFPNRVSEPKQAHPTATSSYKALMKLANLQSSIDDAMETQQKIMAQINDLLDQQPPDKSKVAEEEVALAGKLVATQQRANKAAQKRRDDLKESLRSRRAAMENGKKLRTETESTLAEEERQMETSRTKLEETEKSIRGQRRRICSDLSNIFPIMPIPNAPPLSFQICGIPIPNSVYDAATAKTLNEDTLSAGLGLLALLTRHLQFYLARTIPYPLYPYGSRSSANDEISQLDEKQAGRREFPLFLPRGGSTTGQWRFEYAWFLLNKDIEALCASQGLKVVDIRHSLPNLKYLLYVCSAGTEEVPERKKGGVRGLWLGRLKGRGALGDDGTASLDGSRRGSMDSTVMDHHSELFKDALAKSARPKSPDDGLGLPFDTKFTLRTKGLRENVSK
ncbi:hypothetical protein CC79DRAFT_195880 [Sarocladium strictum]